MLTAKSLTDYGISEEQAEVIDLIARAGITAYEISGSLYIERSAGGLHKVLEIPGAGKAMTAASYCRNIQLQNSVRLP